MYKTPEINFYDTSYNAGGIASTSDCTGGEVDPATILCISAPALGTADNQRVGNRMDIISTHVCGTVMLDVQTAQTAEDNPVSVFIALVKDNQTNGSQLNSEDVFSNPVNTQRGCCTPLRNKDWLERFEILDKFQCTLVPPTFTLNAGGTYFQGGDMAVFELSCKELISVRFKSTAAGVAAIAGISLHVIAFASTGDCTLTYNARIKFVDY